MVLQIEIMRGDPLYFHERTYHDRHRHAEEQLQVIDRGHVERVVHGDQASAILLADWDDTVLLDERKRHP